MAPLSMHIFKIFKILIFLHINSCRINFLYFPDFKMEKYVYFCRHFLCRLHSKRKNHYFSFSHEISSWKIFQENRDVYTVYEICTPSTYVCSMCTYVLQPIVAPSHGAVRKVKFRPFFTLNLAQDDSRSRARSCQGRLILAQIKIH